MAPPVNKHGRPPDVSVLLVSKETNVTNDPMGLNQMVVQNVCRTTTGWTAVMYSKSYCPHSKLKGNDSLETYSVIQGNRYPHRPGHNTFRFLPLFLSAYPHRSGHNTFPFLPLFLSAYPHRSGHNTFPFLPLFLSAYPHRSGHKTFPFLPLFLSAYPHRSGHNTFPFLPLFLSAYPHRSGHNTFPFLPLFLSANPTGQDTTSSYTCSFQYTS